MEKAEIERTEARYMHFLDSRQEPLRLRDALSGYFDPEDEHHRDIYRTYLLRRRSPAAMQLLRDGRGEDLGTLLQEGILERSHLDQMMRDMIKNGQSALWLRALQVRSRMDADKGSARQKNIRHSRRDYLDDALMYTGTGGTAVSHGADSVFARQILRRVRMELYALFPYMDLALFSLKLKEDADCSGIGTDGEYLYYQPEWVVEQYRARPEGLRRSLLHGSLHCLYLHPWDSSDHRQAWKGERALIALQNRQGRSTPVPIRGQQSRNPSVPVQNRQGRNPSVPMQDRQSRSPSVPVQDRQQEYLDNLVKDIQIEWLIERECRRDGKLREKLCAPFGERDVWKEIHPLLASKIGSNMQMTAWLSEVLHSRDPEQLQRIAMLEQQVRRDDHRYWSQTNRVNRKECMLQKDKWEKIAVSIGQAGSDGQDGQGRQKSGLLGSCGLQPGEDREALIGIGKSKTDYRSFLQQFAVFKEELEIDMDSFDYAYYHLGLEQYRDLPLLEPLEYREGHKLEDLVIAIDTSGSIKTETARKFLEEIYAILDEKENFFSRMHVVIIQCDCVIEDVTVIHNHREWEAYLRDLTLIGRSGTDFRPVFRYIEKQRGAGELTGLKGLLYYTDGDGIYPREAPDYQTAFVFVEDTPAMEQVPKWAQVLQTIQM